MIKCVLTGLLQFLQEEDHGRDLMYDLHSGGGDDVRLVELREAGGGLRHTDRQRDGPRASDCLLLLLLQLHQRQSPDWQEDIPDSVTSDPGPDIHCQRVRA